MEELEKSGIDCTVFDGVKPNPTLGNIETGLQVYLENDCDGIIAFGGGSPKECAKMIGARASNPKKSTLKMRGQFKISKVLPPLFAVPTTAGTGSDVGGMEEADEPGLSGPDPDEPDPVRSVAAEAGVGPGRELLRSATVGNSDSLKNDYSALFCSIVLTISQISAE
ncbi:iron-containing alcohol dehydrogenase [bacterium]|nr:iron-containing alcohol dehydrogenase [bacterium]